MFSSLLYGWRSWKSARAIALMAVAALAIGIGSTTAIYSVVHAVMLKPLPYENPERYFYVFGAWRPRLDFWTSFSYPDCAEYSSQVRSLEAFGCFSPGNLNVSVNGQALHVDGTEVSASLLKSLGTAPMMGRWFEDRDRSAAGLRGAVISSGLWRRSGSDPKIVGKVLIMNGEEFSITGVAPAWFRFPVNEAHTDVWVPLSGRGSRSDHYLRAIARLKAGVSREQATAELNRIQTVLHQQHPAENEAEVVYLRSVLDFVLEDIRPSLLLLLGAAVALLFITCANVASLLLARAVARARETATRVALGARSRQLAAEYFSEGLAVSLGGAALGTLLSVLLVRAVILIAADEIPRADQIRFNWEVLAFTLFVAVGCAILFSLAPLWQARRIAPNEVLTGGARTSASGASVKMLRGLVVVEIALAFGLLVLGGVALERLSSLFRVHPGFDPEHLLVMDIFAPYTKYGTNAKLTSYESALSESIRRVPGIESAGFTSLMPLADFGNNTWMYVEGRPKPDQAHSVVIEHRRISPEYFETMKIPLIRGRFLNERDKRSAVSPLLINQATAALYWAHQDPIGAYVTLFGFPPDQKFQIVGVVGDVRNHSLNMPAAPEFYLSFREFPTGHMTWAVRSFADPGTLIPQIQRAVLNVDPDQPVFNARLMDKVIEASLTNQRLESLMVGFFAISALLLAVLGIYGVVAYAVRQRLTEIGTRMAVGATPRALLRLVLGGGLKVTGVGIGIGLLLVMAVARILAAGGLAPESQDRWAGPLLVSALLIATFTLLACWFPAWRASTLSPMVAIRSDLHPSLIRLRVSYRELTQRISELVIDTPRQSGPGVDLLAAMADVSRSADSFADAIGAALVLLRDEVGASSIVLFSRKAADEPYRCSAGTFDGQPSGLTFPADSLLMRRLRAYSSALPLSPEDLDVMERWAREQATGDLAEVEGLKELGAALAVPILSKAQAIGILLLGKPDNRAEYSSAECRALRGAAAQIALMLENSRLTDRIVEQERVSRDLELAGEVQKRLFPQPWRDNAGVQLLGISIPARGVGGDCYDFLDLGNRQVGVALADVAGKGIAAALVTSVVQASLRSLADQNGRSLAELASKMNRLLHRSTGVNSYATFFYAQFDEASRCLRYVNAGHNPPFLLRSGSGHLTGLGSATEAPIEELATGGTIIGMFAQASYDEASLELKAGDVLMLFSDGVSEANDPQENEFGEERLKDVLRRTAHLPISEMAGSILQELKSWMADAVQFDDLTFVLMKVV